MKLKVSKSLGIKQFIDAVENGPRALENLKAATAEVGGSMNRNYSWTILL